MYLMNNNTMEGEDEDESSDSQDNGDAPNIEVIGNMDVNDPMDNLNN